MPSCHNNSPSIRLARNAGAHIYLGKMQPLSPPVPAKACAGPEKSFAQAVPEFGRIYGFDVLNLGAYYGAAGPVLALYIKYLGGSPTFMGLVMACMPACQLTQLFVAPHIEQWGIKRTMLASLALRNAMHTVLAILPFLAGWMLGSNPLGLAQASAPGGFFGLPGATLLLVLFFVMLGFDLCQGLGFSGWMPWVTWLVPEKYRGRYFAFEQMMNNLGQMAFSGVAGWILGEQGSHGNYGSIFAIGAVCGWISLVFLGRITPSPRSADRPAAHSMDLRWMKAVWQITPFRRMMYVIWAHQLMLSVGYFFIFFQKDVLHLTDSFLMAATTVGIAGGLLSVYVWGSLADRFGSKPVMALSYYIVLGINAYWVALALGLPLSQKPVLIAVQFLTVAGLQGYVVTNMRYVLGSLPKDKMVFGTVFYNLTVQVSTMVGAMLWGRVLDLSFIQNIHLTFHNFRLDRFGVVFGCMLLLAILARFMVHRLENRESQSTAGEVAWYALCNDRVTRKIFAYAAFGLAALPVSYLFQPEAVRQALDISLYCLGILQGSGNLGLPPGSHLPWRAAFLTTLFVSMLACTLLCFHRHQRRMKTAAPNPA